MYQQIPGASTVRRLSDGAFLSVDHPDVVAWIAQGNTPSAAETIAPTVDFVRGEAQRRIVALTGASDIVGCLIKQHNAQMRATELTLIKAQGGSWTPEQAAEAAALQGLADRIKAIRLASNVLEPNPPADYADDKHWT